MNNAKLSPCEMCDSFKDNTEYFWECLSCGSHSQYNHHDLDAVYKNARRHGRIKGCYIEIFCNAPFYLAADKMFVDSVDCT